MTQIPYNPNILVAGPQAAPVFMSQDYVQMKQGRSQGTEMGARRRRRRGPRRRR